MTDFQGRHIGYASSATRQVPGLADLHKMTSMLLREKVPQAGRVLVVGAGGGMELKAIADLQAGWVFDGIDPSPDMLNLAREATVEHAARIRLHEGDISVAPEGLFDGAVCLLVFHHIPAEKRVEALDGVRRRLRPGSPFVLAHVSFSQTEPDRSVWIDRHIGFGATDDMDPQAFEAARTAMRDRLHVRSPEDEEQFLREAGFDGIRLFYAALSFRGWVAYA